MEYIIFGLSKHISPLIDNGKKLYDKTSADTLEFIQNGIWSCQVCVNAQTKLFHTELDSTYTIISVPKQNICYYNQTSFEFKIKETEIISIPMTCGTSFAFSAHMLTHKQTANISKGYDGTLPFINIASFGNKRLFTHLRKSLHRYEMKDNN